MLSYQSLPSVMTRQECLVPGDKSISHRALMLSAIADGQSVIRNILFGEDCLQTLKALQAMGVEIVTDIDKIIVSGVGLYGLKEADGSLYLGNAGTAMRLLCGLLSAQRFNSKLSGDASLSSRPMGRVIRPLTMMGAKIGSNHHQAPLVISGGEPLQPLCYELPKASAQVKSALLLAGLYAKGKTTIIEPKITRDHTERMLRAFSYDVDTKAHEISLCGGGVLKATTIDVPGDFSSAAFFIVAALLSKNAKLTIRDVGINPTRTGLLSLLEKMGARLELANRRYYQQEEVADITAYSSSLSGIDVPEALVSLAIDEFPIFFIAASCARGVTKLTGAQELRVKESDRLHVMVTGLKKLAIKAIELEDGVEICGGEFQGGVVNSGGDHRVAMAFCVAGWVAKSAIIIKDCDNIPTSFPGFRELAQQLGFKLEINKVACDDK